MLQCQRFRVIKYMTLENFFNCSQSIQCQAEPIEDVFFILFVFFIGVAGECSIFVYLYFLFQSLKKKYHFNH
jgi:hypothetical protein